MGLVNAYCSVAQVREDLRDSKVLEADIEQAIEAACRWIDNYKGRDYFLHDHSVTPLEIWGGDDLMTADELILPYEPIITLTELTVDGLAWVEGVDFRRRDSYRLRFQGSLFPTSRSSVVRIKGTFGYPLTIAGTGVYAAPGFVVRSAIMLASALSGHLRKDVVGLDGNVTTLSDRTVPEAVLKLIGPPAIRT